MLPPAPVRAKSEALMQASSSIQPAMWMQEAAKIQAFGMRRTFGPLMYDTGEKAQLMLYEYIFVQSLPCPH